MGLQSPAAGHGTPTLGIREDFGEETRAGFLSVMGVCPEKAGGGKDAQRVGDAAPHQKEQQSACPGSTWPV